MQVGARTIHFPASRCSSRCGTKKGTSRDASPSILGQDYPQELLETFVFDGRSTDNSPARLQSACSWTGRVWVVADNPGIVQSNGWNLGIDVGSRPFHRNRQRSRRDRARLREPGRRDVAEDGCRSRRRPGAGRERLPTSGRRSQLRQAVPSASVTPALHYTDTEEEVDTVFQGLCWTEVYDRIGRFDLEMVRNQDDELSYRLRSHRGSHRLQSGDSQPPLQPQHSPFACSVSTSDYGFWKVRVMQKQPRQMQARQFVPAVFVTTLAATTAWAVVAPAGALSRLDLWAARTALPSGRSGRRVCPRRDGRQPPLGPGATGRVRSAACQLRRRLLLRRVTLPVVPPHAAALASAPPMHRRTACPATAEINSELLFAVWRTRSASTSHSSRSISIWSLQPLSDESETRSGLILPASAASTIVCRTGIVAAVGADASGIEAGDKVLLPARRRLRRAGSRGIEVKVAQARGSDRARPRLSHQSPARSRWRADRLLPIFSSEPGEVAEWLKAAPC